MADFFDPLLNTGGMTASSKASKAEVIGTDADFEPAPQKTIVKTKNLFGDDSDDDEPAPKPVLKVKPLSDAIKTPQKPKVQAKAVPKQEEQEEEEEEEDLFKEDNTKLEDDEVVSLTEELAGSSLFEDRADEPTIKESKAAAVQNQRLMASVKVQSGNEAAKSEEELKKEAQERAEMDALLDIGGNDDLDELTSGLVDGVDDELLALVGDGAEKEAGDDGSGFDFNKYIAENSTDDGSALFEDA